MIDDASRATRWKIVIVTMTRIAKSRATFAGGGEGDACYDQFHGDARTRPDPRH